jgi:hypothetical protein
MMLEISIGLFSGLIGFLIGWKSLDLFNQRAYKKMISKLKTLGYNVTESLNPDTGNVKITIKEPSTTGTVLPILHKKPTLH